MAKVERNRVLSDQDNQHIVAFLGSLTGKMPENFVSGPRLPPAAFTEGK